MKEQLSSFRVVFGSSPVVKVLDFLLTYREFDYPLTGIARNADVGWTTINQFWPEIVKIGLVKKTRRIGRAQLYKLDEKNQLAKKLIELDLFISDFFVRKTANKQTVIVRH